jgi:RNA recognition motif-containing protein
MSQACVLKKLFIFKYFIMNIYVANIPFKASEDELKELFEQHGDVTSVKIVMDKLTNRSRGFGFVEMADSAGAKQAIQELNGYNFLGKDLVVNEARPKTDDGRGSGNRGGGGGYGNRGGSGGGGGYNKRW